MRHPARAAFGALFVALLPAGAWGQASLEYEVKAAFVLNFVRYVEWPAAHTTAPLRVCVLRTNPFGPSLTDTLAGEQWQGGPMEVHVIMDMRHSVSCHLLYVPEAAASRFANGRSVLAGRAVLTVGEHERFLEQGGMIHLFLADNRVRFSINQKAADAVGLLISSRLLRLARSVIGTSDEP